MIGLSENKKAVFSLLGVLLLAVVIVLVESKPTIDLNTSDAATGQGYDRLALLTNRVLSLSKEHNKGNAQALAVLSAAASERRKVILETLETDPKSVARVMMAESAKSRVPETVRGLLESDRTVEGVYNLAHADDFDNGIAFYDHIVTDGTNQYEIYFTTDTDKLKAPAGSKIRVSGKAIGNKILAAEDKVQVLSAAESKVAGASTTTVKKVAVILFNLKNNPTQVISSDSARSVVFTGSRSANNFFQESSFGSMRLEGKTRVDGDVYGWYTLSVDDTSNCNYSGWSSEANRLAQADGFSSTGYTNILYVFPSLGGCPGRAWAYVSGTTSFYISGFNAATVAHEMGHNFGAQHANSMSCRDASGAVVTMGVTCSSKEYGDFAMMGATTTYHANNHHKGRFGWLGSGNTKDVTASGTYNLFPQEINTLNTQIIRIPRTRDSAGNVSDYYYLEFRQPIGYDAAFASTDPRVNGVLIRVASGYTSSLPSNLLDATTPELTGFGDAALAVGQTFNDPVSGVSITTQSISPEFATVDVKYTGPTCVRAIPSITVSPSSQWGNAGQSLSYSVTVTNKDNFACGSSSFDVGSVIPPGFTQTPSSYTVSLNPGASNTRSISLVSGSTSAEGVYSFQETISNTNDRAYNATAIANYNVQIPIAPPPPPPPSSDIIMPVINIASPEDGSTIPSKGNVNINVSASDASGISKIQIWVDGNAAKTCNNATSCSFKWSVSKLSSGSHTVTASATDKAGNVASKTITVTR